ncbi:MAG: stage III sporulation protein AF [Lachnospiraceae bacterium]
MFDYIYEWIQNLAFYMIITTAIIQLIPQSTYKRYVRFFTGLLLVVLLVTPILKIFGLEQNFKKIYKNATYLQEIREIEEATQYLEEVEVVHE